MINPDSLPVRFYLSMSMGMMSNQSFPQGKIFHYQRITL